MILKPPRIDNYPLILIPDAITLAKVAKPSKLEFSEETKPKLPGEPSQQVNGIVIGVEAVSTVAVTKLISLHPKGGLASVLFFVLACSAMGVHIWRQVKSYPKRSRDYEDALKIYQQTLKVRKSRRIEQEQEIETASSSEYLETFRANSVADALKKTVKPDINSTQSQTRSKAEDYFLKYLKQFFADRIHADVMLNRRGYGNPYKPDFAYFDASENVCVAIEVDEPYYWNEEKGHSEAKHSLGKIQDDFYNNYFLEQGWIVIRFSEEQAVKQPEACCKIVAKTIHSIIEKYPDDYNFALTPDLETHPRWTQADSTEMMQNSYRESYLSKFVH
jgi:hypothetical protein